MTTFADMVYLMGGIPAIAGVPFGPLAKYYFLDPATGSDSNDRGIAYGNMGTPTGIDLSGVMLVLEG